ncbi:hypothetical protein K1T71_009870 [Dendrolimus kikuchii]|uniref:Uncharacterized protein n=1 Tax=Dendrolimus kikuchii TaxID=765133 RepID=A0ACC1CU47_9NEOP|nr:hypothetical protein K1T71_009870 [Dendrolimus kikuchii]
MNEKKWGIILLLIAGVIIGMVLEVESCEDCADDRIVQLFQKYIQINTTTYNDMTPGVNFWKSLAAQENLPFQVHELSPGYPIIVIEWTGSDPVLSSIMLNSHMDVVPANEEDGWKYPPFSGYIDENGNIYGRGTQDMKSVSLQYFEALRRLRAQGVQLLRTIYMTIMPDEEVGAVNGMVPFLESEAFKALNVGFELDEGTSYPVPMTLVFYQDKVVWQIQVDCYGVAAHGSTFPETNSTATGKCRNVINRLLEYRDEEYEIYSTAPMTDAGIYTSVNLNIISGGTASNVIPAHVSLVIDIRLGTIVNEDKLQAKLEQWITEAGDNITLTYLLKGKQSPATIVDDSNPYWRAINTAAQRANEPLLPLIPPGSTDARFVRIAGIPAFGISPMPDTPMLLHSVDEYINVDTFLKGIEFYKEVVTELGNIPGGDVSEDPSVYLIATTTE